MIQLKHVGLAKAPDYSRYVNKYLRRNTRIMAKSLQGIFEMLVDDWDHEPTFKTRVIVKREGSYREYQIWNCVVGKNKKLWIWVSRTGVEPHIIVPKLVSRRMRRKARTVRQVQARTSQRRTGLLKRLFQKLKQIIQKWGRKKPPPRVRARRGPMPRVLKYKWGGYGSYKARTQPVGRAKIGSGETVGNLWRSRHMVEHPGFPPRLFEDVVVMNYRPFIHKLVREAYILGMAEAVARAPKVNG